MLLLLLLLISHLALHALMRTAIDRASMRNPPRQGHHVSLFDCITALRRGDLRRKYDGRHAMLLISLSCLFRRVDVCSLGLMLKSLSCDELAIISCCNGY